MKMCPKCSRQIDDDRKICRECGAILQETATGAMGESGSSLFEPPSAEKKYQGLPLRSTASVAPSQPLPAESSDDRDRGEEVRVSPWRCWNCGEYVPGNFKICWNCRAVYVEPDAPGCATQRSVDGEAARTSPSADVGPQEDTVTLSHCAKCGSPRIIPDVIVCDRNQNTYGVLKVVVYGNPKALMFKDRRYGDIRADICGECGHLELRVRNPKELYKHYRRSLKG